MSRPLPALLCALLAASSLAGAAAQESTSDLGEVRWAGPIVRVREGTGPEKPFRNPGALRVGQRIRTGRGSGVLLRFDKDGALLLRESTRIVLAPPEKDSLVATVHLFAGAFFLAHDPGKPYRAKAVEVHTKTAVIRLAGGTRLFVRVEPDDTTEVTALQGTVQVAALRNGRTGPAQPLPSGTQIRLAVNRDPKGPFPANPRLLLLTASLGRVGSAGILESELSDVALLLVDPGF